MLAVTDMAPVRAAADAVRPAVGKPLQQAETLIQERDFQAALVKIQQVSRILGLTPYESLVIAEIRGAAAAGAGDYGQAAVAYQTVLASGAESPTQQTLLIQAIAGFYYQARDYPRTIIWVNRYISVHGNDARTHTLLAQAYYESGAYADAEHAVLREVNAAQTTGQAVPEGELQLLAVSAQKSGDQQSYKAALELLLVAYSSPQYWEEAIDALVSPQNFPDRLRLDVYRLRFATGTPMAPADYEDFAERAILGNNPREAKAVIDRGFDLGILTPQTDAGHAARLQVLAAKEAASSPQSPSGYVQQAKDQADTPDKALNLGIAYFEAGDTKHAIENFKTMPGSGDDADSNPDMELAQLWALFIENEVGAK